MEPTTPLGDIKGVGEKTSNILSAAGLKTVADIIEFLPRAYEDYNNILSISDLVPGKVVVRGKISNISSKYVRRGLHITQAVLADGSGKVPITWFNQPYREKHITGGGEWLVAGEFSLLQRRYQIMNPSLRKNDEIIESGTSIVPIYRQISGIKSRLVHKIMEELRPFITMLPEILPQKFVEHVKLNSLADAYVCLHFPESTKDIELGKKRIAFQELLELIYAAHLNKIDNATLKSWQVPFDLKSAKEFVARLPFDLTNDQRRAAWDIVQNFESGFPMNRLLQGDVGSGKTVVAGFAAVMAAQSGYQTAIMAPTELLARQHAETLNQMLSQSGVNLGLLLGSQTKKSKEALKAQISKGAIAVVVGTHALIQETVNFHKLGFVVIDEQHRFGVAQRQKLLSKSKQMPHLLMMTATPIPRSLQLSVYGDLDVSMIQQKPVGRRPILTKINSPVSYKALFAAVDDEIGKGRQVYVVCPLIESNGVGGDEDFTQKSVIEEFDRLQKTAFKHRRIGLLHGKLTTDEKDRVMSLFASGNLDILVSTTVVEVGVDVPNATVMIIEGAERFGLAQLHQLRGRVGRSSHQSYCYLIPTEAKQTTSSRLKELERSQDGFYLAEKDLELRGPGEIYGKAQHGQLNLQVATLSDTRMILAVKASIEWATENKLDLLQYDGMKKRVDKYRRLTTLN